MLFNISIPYAAATGTPAKFARISLTVLFRYRRWIKPSPRASGQDDGLAGHILRVGAGFQPRQTSTKSLEIVLLDFTRAASQQSFAALGQMQTKDGVVRRAGDVAERAHQSQADSRIRDGVMTNLLESEIEQPVQIDPGSILQNDPTYEQFL